MQTIIHAGYEREIISHRPRVYDDDGYEIDSEDDDEGAQAARAAAAEFYPYSEVKIEGKSPIDLRILLVLTTVRHRNPRTVNTTS